MSDSRQLDDVKAIGFIGLGLMGRPMAGHLAAKLPPAVKIYVHDINAEAVESLRSEHPERVTPCANAREVADKTSILITMLPEGRHVQQVYLAPDTGILSSPNPPHLLLDSSTIDTATSSLIASSLATTHPTSSFIDCPVSGGVPGAVAGTIAFFLGCPPSSPHLPLLNDLFSLMGKQIIPCGAPTLGLASKLANNYLSGVIAIAASEALIMGIKSGLDPRTLNQVFAAGTAQNAICDRFCPCPGVVEGAPSSNGFEGGFRVELMRKDFGLAVDMAKRVEAGNVLGDTALETYKEAAENEKCKGKDSRVVYRYLGGDEDWKERIDRKPDEQQ